MRRRTWSRAVALRLLAEYAPPRPVRLLGVRVAGLLSGGGPTARASRRRRRRQAASACRSWHYRV